MNAIKRSATVSTALPFAPRGARRNAARCDRRSSRNSLRVYCQDSGWDDFNDSDIDEDSLFFLPAARWPTKAGDDGTGAPAYA